jgi:hypothetical protein
VLDTYNNIAHALKLSLELNFFVFTAVKMVEGGSSVFIQNAYNYNHTV